MCLIYTVFRFVAIDKKTIQLTDFDTLSQDVHSFEAFYLKLAQKNRQNGERKKRTPI